MPGPSSETTTSTSWPGRRTSTRDGPARAASGRTRCRTGSAGAGRAGRGRHRRPTESRLRRRHDQVRTPRSVASASACRTVSRRRSERGPPGAASMTTPVASSVASWSRSPTRRPSRSASVMMSATSGSPSSATRPSRSTTSALARMSAAGVRSSCDASATNRRWASNDRRIGTRARPVTMSVTIAAPAGRRRRRSTMRRDDALRLPVVDAPARTRPGRSRSCSAPVVVSADAIGTVSSRTGVPPASTVRRSRPFALAAWTAAASGDPGGIPTRDGFDTTFAARVEDQQERVRRVEDDVLAVARDSSLRGSPSWSVPRLRRSTLAVRARSTTVVEGAAA